jgi:hypothetical protein
MKLLKSGTVLCHVLLHVNTCLLQICAVRILTLNFLISVILGLSHPWRDTVSPTKGLDSGASGVVLSIDLAWVD